MLDRMGGETQRQRRGRGTRRETQKSRAPCTNTTHARAHAEAASPRAPCKSGKTKKHLHGRFCSCASPAGLRRTARAPPGLARDVLTSSAEGALCSAQPGSVGKPRRPLRDEVGGRGWGGQGWGGTSGCGSGVNNCVTLSRLLPRLDHACDHAGPADRLRRPVTPCYRHYTVLLRFSRAFLRIFNNPRSMLLPQVEMAIFSLCS